MLLGWDGDAKMPVIAAAATAAVSGVLDRVCGLLLLFSRWKRLRGGDTYTYALWVKGIGYGLILHAGFVRSLSCLEIFISFVPEAGAYSP